MIHKDPYNNLFALALPDDPVGKDDMFCQPTKMNSMDFRLLNFFLKPVSGKNIRRRIPEFLLQNWVMPDDAEFGTSGFLFLIEKRKVDMNKAVIKKCFC